MAAFVALFKPAMLMMNRLKYGMKFFLISLLFLIPISLMSVELYKEIRQDQVSSEHERLGIRYIDALYPVMAKVQNHRTLSVLLLNGDASVKPQLDKEQADIEERIRQIDALDNELSGELQATEMWNLWKKHWQDFKGVASLVKASESYDLQTQLIAELQQLMNQTADNARLTLDSSIETYYLMDAAVTMLPALAESIEQTRGQSVGIAARKTITADEKLMMRILINDMEEKRKQTAKYIDIAIGHTASLEERLRPLAKENADALRTFQETLGARMVNVTAVNIPVTELSGQGAKAAESADALFKQTSSALDEMISQRLNALKSRLWLIAAVNLLALLAACYMFNGFYLAVMDTVRELRRAALEMAAGNMLTQASLDTRDEFREVGKAFDDMSERMRKLIYDNKLLAGQVLSSSRELTATAEQAARSTADIAESMQQIAAGSELQMRGAEETAHAMTEMSAGIQRIAENAGGISDVSVEASRLAGQGSDMVHLAVSQMTSIRGTVQASAQTVSELNGKSQEIGNIIAVITDIAAQTNLLALNASIEAARAGEHGRGFAVVAGEIRKLADQTRLSAGQISSMIEEIRLSSETAQRAMTDGVQEVQKGSGIVMETSELFALIRQSVESMAEQIQEISAAAEEMSAGTEQVAASVDDMLAVARKATEQTRDISASTQEQTASVEQIDASASLLSETAAKLLEDMNKFKV